MWRGPQEGLQLRQATEFFRSDPMRLSQTLHRTQLSRRTSESQLLGI